MKISDERVEIVRTDFSAGEARVHAFMEGKVDTSLPLGNLPPSNRMTSRMQRWSTLTDEERNIIATLSAERSVQQSRIGNLWEVFDELYPNG